MRVFELDDLTMLIGATPLVSSWSWESRRPTASSSSSMPDPREPFGGAAVAAVLQAILDHADDLASVSWIMAKSRRRGRRRRVPPRRDALARRTERAANRRSSGGARGPAPPGRGSATSWLLPGLHGSVTTRSPRQADRTTPRPSLRAKRSRSGAARLGSGIGQHAHVSDAPERRRSSEELVRSGSAGFRNGVPMLSVDHRDFVWTATRGAGLGWGLRRVMPTASYRREGLEAQGFTITTLPRSVVRVT